MRKFLLGLLSFLPAVIFAQAPIPPAEQGYEKLRAALKSFDKAAVVACIAPIGAPKDSATTPPTEASIADDLLSRRAQIADGKIISSAIENNFSVVRVQVSEGDVREFCFCKIGEHWKLGTRPFFRQLTAEENATLNRVQAKAQENAAKAR